jgi:Right handed beta helix region
MKLQAVPGQVTRGKGWHWASQGYLSVDTDGAVLQGLDVAGSIEVTANNVTIEDVRVVQDGDTYGIGLLHTSNVTISHCEVYSETGSGASRLEVGIKDIAGDTVGTTVEYTNVWHTSTGIQISAGLVQDNYVHDMGYTSGDHINGFTSNAGRGQGLTVNHNTILDQMDQTDAISLFEDFGAQYDALVENNLIAGGSYTLYAGANSGGQATYNIRVIGNRFSRVYYHTGGVFGPVAAYDPSGSGNVWQGNIWDDSGTTLNHP